MAVVASTRMPENVAVESTRRRLSGKRADTVRRLSEPRSRCCGEVGYHDLTLQAVAARAGAARATAYTYFSSKDHLIAEVYWRRLATEQPPESPTNRCQDPGDCSAATPGLPGRRRARPGGCPASGDQQFVPGRGN